MNVRTLITEEPIRLDKFLVANLTDTSRAQVARWIEAGLFAVNDEIVKKPGSPLKSGVEVTFQEPLPSQPIHDLTPADLDVKIWFEDDDMLVVEKPRGVATHPAPGLREATLVNALLGRNVSLSEGSEEFRPGIVHRLDKDTTGLLMVAKTELAHRVLAGQIAAKTALRRYFALASGIVPENRMTIDAPIGRDPKDRRKMCVSQQGKEALTHFKLLHVVEGNSLVVARLETGRTHQIRVHLSAAGYPVIGDRIYNRVPSRLMLQLHAAFLEFDHPTTGERQQFYCPPPKDFVAQELCSREAIENWD